MLEQTAKEGNRRATLEALRDRLSREIDLTDKPLEVSQLSSRLVEVLKDIDSLPPAEQGGTLHGIRGGRTSRRQSA